MMAKKIGPQWLLSLAFALIINYLTFLSNYIYLLNSVRTLEKNYKKAKARNWKKIIKDKDKDKF